MISAGQRLAEGRLLKRKQAEERKEKKRAELAEAMSRKLRLEHNELKKQFCKLEEQIQSLQSKQAVVEDDLLSDLINHTGDTKEPYTSELIALAMEIQALSPKIYSLLVKKLHFPNESYINSIINDIISDIPDNLTDIDKAAELISLYREKNELKGSDSIDACLAVDAIAFTQDVKVSADGKITGLKQETSSSKLFKMFTKDVTQFQKFLDANSEDLIRAGFVFQIQPYDVRLEPFIIHVEATVNGKANQKIVEILHEIRKICKNRNIKIRSYAFDGDTAYYELHKIYYQSYINKAIEEHSISFDRTRTIRTVSDLLHIIKRLRYRLLSSIIHCGFNIEEEMIDLENIKKILNHLQKVVWNDDLYTKMHDKLPLELFNIENFLKLFLSGEYVAASYWFPISLSILAVNAPDLGFSNRKYLLESAFWFLVFFKDCWDNAEPTLRQKKYKDQKDVMFYTNDLLIEFTNTIYCHLQLMTIIPSFSFDRNSTTPLEHKFGNARVRAKDRHTLAKFLKNVSIMQAIDTKQKLSELDSFQQDIQINGRTNSFGVTVESPDDEEIYEAYERGEKDSLENEKKVYSDCIC